MATLQDLEAALVAADKAGAADDARMLAGEIVKMRGQPQATQAPVDARDAIGEAHTKPEAFGIKTAENEHGFNLPAAIIATGQWRDKVGQGYDQMKTAVEFAVRRAIPGAGKRATESLDALMDQEAAESEKDRLYAKLQKVHPGSTLIGQTAPALLMGPTTMAVTAATEYGSPQERLMRAGAVVAGNKLAQKAGQSAATRSEALTTAKSANAARDANVMAAKEAGYVALPSEVGGSTMGRVLEGLSGKAKSAQLASVKNQVVTDGLVRKAVGLADDVPITREAMQAIRSEAHAAGYEPLKQWGGGTVRIKPDSTYQSEIKALTSRADNAAEAFGTAVKSDLESLIGGMTGAKPFTTTQGVDAIAILREQASSLYAKGDKSAGKAYREAAEIIERQIERTLTASGTNGKQLLAGYKGARQTMAKTFDVEKALREGSGSVEAKSLGNILKKSPNKLSGELKAIAQASLSMPQATRLPQQGWSSPVTAMDSLVTGGIALGSGSALPLAVPAARAGIREGLLTGAGQKMFAKPKYDSGLLSLERLLLENQAAPRIGGLLGYGVNP